MRGAGCDVGDIHRTGIKAHGDESGNVGHVGQQVSVHAVGDIFETLPVQKTAVGRKSGDNHPGPMLLGQLLNLVVVDLPGIGVQAVLHGVIQLAGKIDSGAVSQVPTMGKAHTEHSITWVEQRHVHSGVGTRTRVRLHIDIGRSEQLLSPVNRQLLGDVDKLAAPVIALARIAFGILVC